MSNKYNSPFEGMDWSMMQKLFMDAMMKSNTNPNPFAGGGNPFSGATNPFTDQGSGFSSPNWADAMDYWWRAFKPETTSGNDNIFNKMMEQCRTYYMLSEQFAKLYEGMENAKQNSEDYAHFLNEQFQNMESIMADNQQLFSWSNFVDQCEQPAELLKNLLSSSPLYTGDAMNDFSPELRKAREKFLTMPGLGYSRETQEKMQEALHLWAVYQDSYQEFHAVMSRLNHEAMDLMRKRMLKMQKDGEDIESMRQIYHIWVDSNEKVYGEFVMTEDYAELNAKLVNSLMAFKNKSHEITEDYLNAMNLPTSGAIDALERRQYELRKQVRAMQAELKQVKSELSGARQEPVKENAAAATEKTVLDKQTAKTPANKKSVAKRKRKAKKDKQKKSSQVVDFKKSQLEKQKKMQSADKKSKTDADETSKADAKRMIEIKF